MRVLPSKITLASKQKLKWDPVPLGQSVFKIFTILSQTKHKKKKRNLNSRKLYLLNSQKAIHLMLGQKRIHGEMTFTVQRIKKDH